MRRFTFTQPNGLSTVLSSLGSDVFFITSVDGLDIPQQGIQTQKAPYELGERFVDSRFPPRDLSFSGFIKVPNNLNTIATYRRQLTAGLSAFQDIGTLLYEYNGGSKILHASVIQPPIFTNRDPSKSAYQLFSFVLRAYDPFWYDTTSQSSFLQTLTKRKYFTWGWPSGGREYGIYNTAPATISNGGDVPTPPTFTIFGPTQNPKLTNQTTGKFLSIHYTILAGDKMVITTGFGNKNVVMTVSGVTVSGMVYLDIGSEFWSLIKGNNSILLSDDTALISAQVQINWTNRYVGV